MLKGGIADYGFREYTTTAATEFSAPTEKKEFRPPEPRSKLRYGMVTPQTLTEAGLSYGEGAPPALRFDPAMTSIARVPTVTEVVRMPSTSTMREAMATPVEYTAKAAALASKEDKALLHSAFAPAAGGAGSLRLDRGKRSLGITGEMLRIGDDPKLSTEAQRAWIQRRDPGIHAYRNPVAPTHDASYMSLPIHGAAADTVRKAPEGAAHGRFSAFAAAPRVVTDVTATEKDIAKRHGRRVFSDE